MNVNLKMVGRVGYAPTTPAMSMQYSTIELTALIDIKLFYYINFLMKKIFVFSFTAYIIQKLIINNVILKSLKKDPLGNNGIKFIKI